MEEGGSGWDRPGTEPGPSQNPSAGLDPIYPPEIEVPAKGVVHRLAVAADVKHGGVECIDPAALVKAKGRADAQGVEEQNRETGPEETEGGLLVLG